MQTYKCKDHVISLTQHIIKSPQYIVRAVIPAIKLSPSLVSEKDKRGESQPPNPPVTPLSIIHPSALAPCATARGVANDVGYRSVRANMPVRATSPVRSTATARSALPVRSAVPARSTATVRSAVPVRSTATVRARIRAGDKSGRF